MIIDYIESLSSGNQLRKPEVENIVGSGSYWTRVLFFPTEADLLLHVKKTQEIIYYQLSDFFTIILYWISGNGLAPTSDQFENEEHFIEEFSRYENLNIRTVEDVRQAGTSLELIKIMIFEYIGFNLFKQRSAFGREFLYIDTSELDSYERREGYDRLSTLIEYEVESFGNIEFYRCVVDGITYTKEDDGTPELEMALRKVATAILTIVTLKYHLGYIHVSFNEKINYCLEKQLSLTNPIRRFLTIVGLDKFQINESSMLGLLGNSGVPSNLTAKGAADYLKHSIENINFRELFDWSYLARRRSSFFDTIDTDTIHIEPTIQVALGFSQLIIDGLKWWKVIYNFSRDFVLIHYQTDEDLPDEVINFLIGLKEEYIDIVLDRKPLYQNLIDICAMCLFSNVVHETFSNERLGGLISNPFILSTTWKEGSNHVSNLPNKINGILEAYNTFKIVFLTSQPGKLLKDDFSYLFNDGREKEIYTTFYNEVNNLDISEDSIIHPSKVECSVLW